MARFNRTASSCRVDNAMNRTANFEAIRLRQKLPMFKIPATVFGRVPGGGSPDASRSSRFRRPDATCVEGRKGDE